MTNYERSHHIVVVSVIHYSHNRPNGNSFMSDEFVPILCVHGTITWNYPMGHGRVHYMNPYHKPLSVCIRGRYAWFNITDVTNGSPGIPIGNYTDRM